MFNLGFIVLIDWYIFEFIFIMKKEFFYIYLFLVLREEFIYKYWNILEYVNGYFLNMLCY